MQQTLASYEVQDKSSVGESSRVKLLIKSLARSSEAISILRGVI